MKKLFILFYSLIIGVYSYAFGSGNLNEKLLQSFKESFPNAEQVKWDERPETYVVSFVEDGIRTNINYDKNGTFVSSIRYYQERTLPYYLVINLKRKYPEKKIYGIVEYSTILGIEYYVKMEDGQHWTTIKLDSDGSMRIVKKYKKLV